MNKLFLAVAALLCTASTFAQQSLRIKIINAGTKEPLAAATVSIPSLKRTVVSDSLGIAAFQNLFEGKYQVNVSYVGFTEKEFSLTIPFTSSVFEIDLEPEEEDEEEVVIQSTRSSRTISDIPTRVEFVAGEELDEKANMKPGDIRMVLTESTGIQTQQTSATSANALESSSRSLSFNPLDVASIPKIGIAPDSSADLAPSSPALREAFAACEARSFCS